MKNRLIPFLLFAAALLGSGSVAAREATDSVRVYYRRGHRTADPAYRENRSELARFLDVVRRARAEGRAERLVIRSYASPDGAARSNERLSRLRADSLESFLRRETGLPASMIEKRAEGIAWQMLRELAAASEMPARDEAVRIIDRTPVWIFDAEGRIVDGRKKRLMELRGGVPYRYMMEQLFPVLRSSLAVTLYTKTDEKAEAARRDSLACAEAAEAAAKRARLLAEEAARRAASEQAAAKAAARAAAEAKAAAAKEAETKAAEAKAAEAAARRAATDAEPLHRLALKTNLLYDAILMPSLGIEYRIDDRWSVALEADVAWWRRDSRHKYYQIATLMPEARYWFRTRKPWHGHYVGAFVGGSWYDLENGGKGYKGEAAMIGVSYGYMWPVSRSLSFEAGIGAGYLNTKYREYRPEDGHYLYNRKGRTNYFGPLKVRFALVWRLWDARKTKKGDDQ